MFRSKAAAFALALIAGTASADQDKWSYFEVPGPVRAQLQTTFRTLLRLCNARASHNLLAPAARSPR